MSFAEKIATLMARPGQTDQQQSQSADVPWFMRYGAPLLGTIGAFFSILFGFYNTLGLLTLNFMCLVAGALQIVIGFFILAVEAPCCCFFIEHAKIFATTADSRPLWNRAACYCALAVIPLIMCFGLGSLFPGLLIFGTGTIYGMMSLGKKASAEEMRNAAMNSGFSGVTATTPTSNDRASIVKNAQPFSFTGAVGTDSNV
ncbi:calcium channel flower isoform X1 [Eupeodes corollae]|uniref:calcium channel flower isoform X1 n=1 Tax=Eupeodes corollae TaxID=290404 RepID=UPI0024901F03|nr:calcium channel flower isoform X1 [Eupeodes corollae]